MGNSDLEALVARMKANAEANPADPKWIAAELAQGRIPPFPDLLKGYISLEGKLHQLQFSHDTLSNGVTMLHLSCAAEGMQKVSDSVKKTLRQAFFGDQRVMEFAGEPGVGAAHVTHLAVIRREQ